MRGANSISEEILQSIDVMNTIGGGVSEPVVRLTQFPSYRQIELSVPGIREQNMHVKVNNNQLMVYFEHRIESRGQLVSVPHIVYNKPIPYFINTNKIKAVYSDGCLTIQLPYNELANGFHRDIPIES